MLSLGTSRSYRDAQNKRKTETELHRNTCFNGIGKSVDEHLANGAMLMVTGRNNYIRWIDHIGTDRYGCELISKQVNFLAKLKDAKSTDTTEAAELALAG